MTKTPASSVDLVPHDPSWAALANAEGDRLCQTLGGILITVHHIGSTAIPDIHAKPILDLMPVVVSIEQLEDYQEVIASIGYDWRGEFGLPGRRYCTRNDPATGRRLVNAHCYQQGSSEIDRHLAFRDYLRDHPDLARAYEQEKQRCRALHADDIATYTDCKDDWIRRVEAEALLWKNGQP
jgi:GrpB-like predicted nucleotidyltransferase (UPF0157 family)